MSMERLTDFIRKEMRSFVADVIRPVSSAVQTAPDEARLIEAATEGSAARAFLESAVVQEFVAQSEAQLTTAMLGLALDDDAGRRNLAVAIQTQRQLWRFLAAKAGDAKRAEHELERLTKGPRPYF